VGDDKILTALHCVEDAELGEAIEYVVHDDVYEAGSALERSPIRTRRAFLLAVDPGHDMALLRAPAYPKGHPVALTALTPVLQGARTQAMGQSLGLWWSYSTGDVAAIRQTEINGMDILWVQTTAATSPGNSGGGLFDEVGQLIGLCHATAVRGQNVNFYVHKVYIDSFLRAAGA
jgi:S1-C subfamily serine protease